MSSSSMNDHADMKQGFAGLEQASSTLPSNQLSSVSSRLDAESGMSTFVDNQAMDGDSNEGRGMRGGSNGGRGTAGDPNDGRGSVGAEIDDLSSNFLTLSTSADHAPTPLTTPTTDPGHAPDPATTPQTTEVPDSPGNDTAEAWLRQIKTSSFQASSTSLSLPTIPAAYLHVELGKVLPYSVNL